MAATLAVDTTSDDVSLTACTAAPADCSLRGAIAAANVLAGADAIEFNIPTSDPGCSAVTGICRIEVASSLSISEGLTIDGYTQPGAQPNSIPAPGANNAQLKIEITSAGFVNLGVALFSLQNSNAGPFNLRGLAIALPTSAIVTGGLRHDHRGNWFCVDALGQSPEFNLPCNAFTLTGFNRTIRVGGPDPADRNVIAGGGRDLNGQPGGGTNRLRVNSIVSERGSILLQGNLIGLAPETPEHAGETATRHAIEIDILSDSGNRVAQLLGLVFELPEELRAIYARNGIDIPAFNGDDSFRLPVPATYIVDQAGMIAYAFVNADYTQRLEPAGILDQLAAMSR